MAQMLSLSIRLSTKSSDDVLGSHVLHALVRGVEEVVGIWGER